MIFYHSCQPYNAELELKITLIDASKSMKIACTKNLVPQKINFLILNKNTTQTSNVAMFIPAKAHTIVINRLYKLSSICVYSFGKYENFSHDYYFVDQRRIHQQWQGAEQRFPKVFERLVPACASVRQSQKRCTKSVSQTLSQLNKTLAFRARGPAHTQPKPFSSADLIAC